MLHPSNLAPSFERTRRWLYRSLPILPAFIRCDVGLIFLVLLIASFVSASPAPRPQYSVAPGDLRATQSTVADDMVVTLSATPNRPGQNAFTAFAASTRRPAPAEIIRVILRFTYQERDLGRVSAVARQIERDRFVAGGSQASLAGAWAIDVVVRRRGMEDTVARFDWMISPAGEREEILPNERALRPVTDPLALSALLLLAAAGVVRLSRSRHVVRFRIGSAPRAGAGAAVPEPSRWITSINSRG